MATGTRSKRTKKRVVEVLTTAPRKCGAPDVPPVNEYIKTAANKTPGCLSCPILPTIKGVKIGDDYKGGRAAHDDTTLTHRIRAIGGDKAKVLIVFDNPDAKEDEAGEAAIGREAKDIKSALESAGVDWRNEVRFTYSVKCCAFDAACVKTTAMRACSQFLAADIHKFDPDIIVPIGSAALQAVVGPKYNIKSCQGSPFRRRVGARKRTVFPMYPPGILFYQDTLRPIWNKGWENLAGLMSGKVKIGQGMGRYKRIRSAALAAKMFSRYNDTTVSFDFETNCLNPYNNRVPVVKILKRNGDSFTFDKPEEGEEKNWPTENATIAIVSWTDKMGRAWYVLRDHNDGDWTDADRRIFDESFRKFLRRRSVKKVVFNEMFEGTWCLAKYRTPIINVRDAMAVHHEVDEESSHALDNAATQFTSMGNWKQRMDMIAAKFNHNYKYIPVDIIGPYAGADADAALRLDNELMPKLDAKRRRLVNVFYPRVTEALCRAQTRGAKGDPKAAAFFEKFTRRQTHNAMIDVRRIPEVRRYARHKRRSELKKGNKKWELNLDSHFQVKDILFDEYKYEPLKFTDEEEESPSSDKDSLNHFIRQYQCPFSDALLDWRLYSKQHSTYALNLLDQLATFDGYIRGYFKPTGTVTGRLSSSDPNLQNQPRASRRLYISRFKDGCIVQADYSQIEVRIAASLANERLLVEAYIKGMDVHLLTMCRIFGYTEEEGKALKVNDPAKYEERRTIAKRIVFGVLYGSGAPGIVGTLRKEGVLISEEKAQEYIDKFFGVYTDLDAYCHEVVPNYISRTGYTKSPTGRRRHLPGVWSADRKNVSRALRQGPNAIIQGTASDITLTALVLIDEELRRRKMRAIIIITVHDSILIDCPRNEVEAVIKIVKTTMEEVPQRSASIWGKKFNWSWLRCPLVAEIKIGYNWRDAVEMKKDMSVDDALKAAADMTVREDTRYADIYTFSKLHGVEHAKLRDRKFMRRIEGTLAPGKSKGSPLERKDRRRLRKLYRLHRQSTKAVPA